jgi:hypothetical protein
MAVTQRLLTLNDCTSIETKQLTVTTWCVDGVPSNNRMINYMVYPKMVTIKARVKLEKGTEMLIRLVGNRLRVASFEVMPVQTVVFWIVTSYSLVYGH